MHMKIIQYFLILRFILKREICMEFQGKVEVENLRC